MTKLEAALMDMTTFLDERQIPYMIIGGFANLHWGVERFTKDIDITVEVAEEALEALIRQLKDHFDLGEPDPLEFARRNHLIRLQTKTGVPVDLILAALPYELSAIRRAATVEVGDKSVRLCSPEDLIIHKLASERPQDAVDVEEVVLRQSRKLDRGYLESRVRELAAGLERPDVLGFYEECLRKADALPN